MNSGIQGSEKNHRNQDKMKWKKKQVRYRAGEWPETEASLAS